jgi:hypothetical protein
MLPLAVGLIVVLVPHAPLRLRAHLAGPSARWGLNMLALLSQRGLGEKSVGGDGADLAVDGVSSGLYHSVLARIGLGVRSEWRQWAHSASCVAVMA